MTLKHTYITTNLKNKLSLDIVTQERLRQFGAHVVDVNMIFTLTTPKNLIDKTDYIEIDSVIY